MSHGGFVLKRDAIGLGGMDAVDHRERRGVMARDDELDQLVTKVHDALTRTRGRGWVTDLCDLRHTGTTEARPTNFAAVDSLSPKADPITAPGHLRVIDLCGLCVTVGARKKGGE
jgi:hypothetical protein